ncbi:ATP-binding protein [Streptomyces malaysiensis]|uniref:Membrane protein n=1 Tax=Streptomyces malaysiensis TaxID=92644 RepID=A0A7X5XB12_STRMQ|nr:ATP-binding protein [Streptomyces malaysiensis]NIY69929.1 membrane protein [Streptomyces malaysiensis]
MARRPLPRLRLGSTAGSSLVPLVRGRAFARTAADGVADVLHPLVALSRGLRVLATAGRRKWVELPGDRRGPVFVLVVACGFVLFLLPYGPLAAAISLIGAAGWAGRGRATAEPRTPGADGAERLRTLYEALVPYFSAAEDPSPLYSHGGDWSKAFDSFTFDEGGRLTRLHLQYPAYFTDGEPAARTRIEQLLYAKSGRGREYLFEWDEEANGLTLTVLPALSTTIHAQRFVTTPGETVLGFTDPSSVQRTLPVLAAPETCEESSDGTTPGVGLEKAAGDGPETHDVPPVVWRTGPRSTEPHLLALGEPGSGTTTLLRSIALQALPHGEVLVVDGGGTGEYACLSGRTGVLAVECGLAGMLATLEWAGHETERRLIAANRARQLRHPPPEDIRRPLWILLDRPSVMSHLAAADGRTDPQELLAVPLRHGRAANVRVVVADQLDAAEALSEAVRSHTRARVVLGPVSAERVAAVLGAPPHTTPTPEVPPGRGYARLGAGPVHRLQVPATPDPYDEAASEAERQAVLRLLPAPDPAAPAAPAPVGG